MNPNRTKSSNIRKSLHTLLLGLLLIFISGNTFSQPVCDAHFQFYTGPNNPDSLHFYPQNPVNNLATYLWTFGDGTTSNNISPWHNYASPGAYYVCLTVTLSNGMSCNWCDSIHIVNQPPPPPPACNAHFQFYRNHHNSDSLHFFAAGPSNTTATYLWSFGDGTTSNGNNPWHLFPGNGTYWVCLTITLANGNTCTWCDSVHVFNPPPPPPPICNAHFQFYRNPHNTDSLHFYPNGISTNVATYAWSFGDGTTSTNMSPWHLYANTGTYWVCLTVTLPNGTTCNWCDSIHVMNPPPPPPPVCNAHFQFNSNNHNPDSVHFFPQGPATNLATYLWSFGDGTTSTNVSPWHLYANAGAYWVCLTVTLPNGTTCNWCDSIHVMNPPPPPPPVCNAHFQFYSNNHNPDSVHFYPQNPSTNLATYLWSFGDGTTSTNLSPWHVYANAGAYWVCLTITLSNGTTCTWCDSIHIMNPPPPPACNAQFQFYPNPHNSDSIHYYPAMNAAISYLWSFGDGTTSTAHDPWHYYPISGTYFTCLTATDLNGNTCTWCDSVHARIARPGLTALQKAEINIYPNPVNSILTISTSDIGDAEFEIYDLTGKRVYQINIQGNTLNTVNTSQLHEGLYYYFIRSEGANISQGKIIIVH